MICVNKNILVSFCLFRSIEVIFSLFTDTDAAGAAANGELHVYSPRQGNEAYWQMLT